VTTKIVKTFDGHFANNEMWKEIRRSDKVLFAVGHTRIVLRYMDSSRFCTYKIEPDSNTIIDATLRSEVALTTDADAVEFSNRCLALVGEHLSQFCEFNDMMYDNGPGWQRYWFCKNTGEGLAYVVYEFDNELDAIEFKLRM
jgi:hypothetical protein